MEQNEQQRKIGKDGMHITEEFEKPTEKYINLMII